LKSELLERAEYRTIIGTSPQMARVSELIAKVADSDASVLITGESGTGKELVARSLHRQSSRCNGPFIAINCAAIPRDLLESELFGHAKGAFTGALTDKAGKFLLANGGTVFLDEIGEMPLELQPKLLRVLQERIVEPLGSGQGRRLDIRVLAATNLDIDQAVASGRFREDLYYRLAVVQIDLPPLRVRRDDIPVLLRHFCEKHGGVQVRFAAGALEALCAYDWPGNVRELENMVERLLLMRSSDTITVAEIPSRIRAGNTPAAAGIVNLPDSGYSLEQLEREIVVQALQRCGWNQAAAARFLRIPRHTLIYRMEKYQIHQDMDVTAV
jgi:two-component system NtrC family response regulator